VGYRGHYAGSKNLAIDFLSGEEEGEGIRGLLLEVVRKQNLASP
jgi:hypothetical protein